MHPVTYSVLISAYNVETFIGEAVTSVLRRKQHDLEVVVVDDGSTDNTAAVLAAIADPRLRVVRQANRGLPAARNAALAEARGRFLVFLDGDDRVDPLTFDAMAEELEKSPEIVVVYGDYRRITETGEPIAGSVGKLRARPSGRVLERLLRGNFIATPAMAMVRAETARRIGGFNPRLRMSEDWEFWCRAACQGRFVYRGDLQVLEFRQRGSSMTRTLGLDPANYQPALEAVYSHPDVRARVHPERLARLRRLQENHVLTYIACQTMRSGALGLGMKRVWRALRHEPSRAPDITLRCAHSLIFR